MKKIFLLIIFLACFTGCLQSVSLGIYQKIEIMDNDNVTTTTGDISDTNLDVSPLP